LSTSGWEIFTSETGQTWSFRFVSRNGRKVAYSTGFSSQEAAQSTVDRICDLVRSVPGGALSVDDAVTVSESSTGWSFRIVVDGDVLCWGNAYNTRSAAIRAANVFLQRVTEMLELNLILREGGEKRGRR
jgi:uncharacterized protein YegP (UPF0339 family)